MAERGEAGGLADEARAGEGWVLKPTPPDRFVDHGCDRETRWEALAGTGYLVPNDLFYVRNHAPTPRIDADSWRLRVEGDGVAGPCEFDYANLLAMPAVTLVRMLECAGNGRRFYRDAEGQPVPGTPWSLGAAGVAEWTGVPLRRVLEVAGLKPTARDLLPEGLDEGRFARPLPIEKALADDTLLAYRMNGEPLPPDHGFPVRLLVSGWAAVASIKWLGRIEVSEQPLRNRWNTEDYVLIGPGYAPEPPADGQPLTALNVKSAFELPWPAILPPGAQRLRGRAWSGHGAILQVEVSIDDGPWQPAGLSEPNLPMAWACWEFDWQAAPGDHRLRARAVDDQGITQPDAARFNAKGYLYDAVVEHPVRVEE